ncbi:guanylate-binding protein 1-like [Apus apus]|uniref:guanylate-binding protein 1-like n=1 Tax=Apus apus TaxID=8895 RepID=UPI0021F907FE|nr:guanylate-binding protein 1-like isoform X1 [Apus apus]XP_051497530.1 guanylate-binding protein 1-like [Apus apus]XP_051497531.1 guanylate-binding protein 1-like [Apus apus]
MASTVHMPAPVCLIENSPTKGLMVQREALQLLSKVSQPVVVVAITGPYRTGKSYLMNRLAGERRGFSLGSSVQSQTKGIWMWCVRHPRRPGHTLVLLDSEGLSDAKKSDTKNDTWIFVLTVLLSSTMIYNSKGTIDQNAMDQLHYVTKLTERIKLKAAPKKSEDELDDSHTFVSFFPTFVWAVRDFTLQLQVDGEEISEDGYLEDILKLKAGSSPETQLYNHPRECIRQFFPERKCFVFDQPAGRRKLPLLEELPDDELDPDFQQQVEKFCSYIWEKSPPKTVPGGHIVTGNLLGKLAETYLEVIRSGAVPCLESAVFVLAKAENAAAVEEAVRLYQELMEQRAKLPTETLEQLLELHAQCEREALELFMARAFKEDIEHAQIELARRVEAIKVKFSMDNEQASQDKCEAALTDLSQALDKRVRDGVYSVSGGYEQFRGDQQAVVEKYRDLPGKGVKADAVLLQFLQRTQTLAQHIRNTDRSLTEKDKEMKSAQEQNERAEQEREVQRKKEAEEKQKLQDQLRKTNEHERQLRKKLEDSYKKQLEEQEKIIRHKLEEERALRQEGFFDRADHMSQVTRRLEEEKGSITHNLLSVVETFVPLARAVRRAISAFSKRF